MQANKGSKADSPRVLAAELLFEIAEKGAYANLLLEKELGSSKLKSEDKNLVTEIVNGSTRMLKHLDWVLDLFLADSIKKANPWLRSILRMTAYQLLFMDRIPAYAAINDAVTITNEKTNKNLGRVANGVLRNLARNQDNLAYPQDKAEYLAVYYSHPQWMVTLFLDKYGFAVTEKILLFNNRPPRLTVRNNQLRGTREDLGQLFTREKIDYNISPRLPWALNIHNMPLSLEKTAAYREGYFYVQNEAAMLAAPIIKAFPGCSVYDLCSGVGGKTTHLAEIMQNEGSIRAYDLYSRKLKLLQENCARLGIKIVAIYHQDLLAIGPDAPLAERVLLDAPCSGLGVLNRRSDLRWRQDPLNMGELPQLQLQLLQTAGRLVAENGCLLYSTCTINSSENEMVVRQFLQENPEFALESFQQEITYFGLDDEDRQAADQGLLTIIPGKYDTDGMFYALMRRKT